MKLNTDQTLQLIAFSKRVRDQMGQKEFNNFWEIIDLLNKEHKRQAIKQWEAVEV